MFIQNVVSQSIFFYNFSINHLASRSKFVTVLKKDTKKLYAPTFIQVWIIEKRIKGNKIECLQMLTMWLKILDFLMSI